MPNITVFDTDLQNRIATLLTKGLSQSDVARECECNVSAVHHVYNSAKFLKYNYNSAMVRLINEGTPEAISALVDIVKDKNNSSTSRVGAADKILTHTGCIVNEQGGLEKSPANMTQDELKARLAALQNEAASRAQPVIIDQPVHNSVDKLLD